MALLNPCFWPEVRRGSERFAWDLGSGLMARGHRPQLITSHPGWPSRSVEGGLPIVRNWRPPQWRLPWYQPYLTHIPFSYASLRQGNYELAHALYLTDGLAAVQWGERTGRPVVYTIPGMPTSRHVAGRLRREMLRRVLSRSTVVAISEASREALRRTIGADARVIPQGVDLSTFSYTGPRSDTPTIFCPVAVDDSRKRVDLLIEAFESVRHKCPDARLVLSRRTMAAESLNRPARLTDPGVELADVDGDEALARHYGHAWVTALPARREAFGLVLIESLACGTPVVGTDEGGISEIVDRPGIGDVFEPDNAQALARALLDAMALAEDPGTRSECRARAADFSIERNLDSYEQLYCEVT